MAGRRPFGSPAITLCLSLVVLSGLLLLAPRAAHGGEIAVTSLADDGPGTLRQALSDAHDGDTITFGVHGTIQVAMPLTIARAVTVRGPDYPVDGEPLVQVGGGGLTSVLLVEDGATVDLENLGIRDGNAGRSDSIAGGITNHGALRLTRCLVASNLADYRAGIYSKGDLTLDGCQVLGNRGGYTGGIYQLAPGVLIIRASRLDNNQGGQGGALATAGDTTIEDSRLRGNQADEGAGVYAWFGHLTVRRSMVTGNVARLGGGGIYADGALLVEDSLIADNSVGATASVRGGGLRVRQGLIVRSTITGNRANEGGGILATEADYASGWVQIANSTIADNTAWAYTPRDGVVLPGIGGGISVQTKVSIVNSTITGNRAEAGAPAPAGGGGIGGDETPVLINSIVAGNEGGNCATAVNDGGGNLQHPGQDCGTTLPSADPLLGDWTGGLAPGLLPRVGSPAIDAGVPATCAMAPVLGVDQRGFARPTGPGGHCDSGSIEVESSATPTPGYTPATTPTPGLPDLVPGGLFHGPDTGSRCVGPDTIFGLFVGVANRGLSAAGPFAVTVDSTPVTHPGLAAGRSAALFLPQFGYGQHTIVVDANDEVAESREDNNTLTQWPIVGTLPAPCTLTPTIAPTTATPTLPPTATATPRHPSPPPGSIWLPYLLAGPAGY